MWSASRSSVAGSARRYLPAVPTLIQVGSGGLRPDEVTVLADLFEAAWRNKNAVFTDEDREHAFGGMHFLIEHGGEILAHASVVPRELHIGEHHLNTGYVEGVATWPAHQGRGYGTTLMTAVGEYLDELFELGGLSTGVEGFYERFGWMVWEGPTYCRTDQGPVRTTDDDGGVLVKLTPASPALDLSAPISCNMRLGDVW
jgi:aminoglycoside 2'-N-acetyltransferase I